MEKQTVHTIQKKKTNKIPITALTCYDAFTAQLVDSAEIDIALVGDSLANTRLGYPNTLAVTFDEMLHHVRAASRGISNSLLVADMPFMTYEAAPWEAAKFAGHFLKKGRAHAVKCEGGRRIGPSIKAILKANIPVMGHVGLTPQSIHQFGGYRVQGKSPKQARKVLGEAKYLQSIGVFAIVLEGIPSELGKKITRSLKIPTIGIGAGVHCDGQVLVLDDLLGLQKTPPPKFVKKFANLRPTMINAIRKFRNDVQKRKFPTKEFSY